MKRRSPAEIVVKLRQMDAMTSRGGSLVWALPTSALWCGRGHISPLAQGAWRAQARPDALAQGNEVGKQPAKWGRLGPSLGKVQPDRGLVGKANIPSHRQQAVQQVRSKFGISERRACQIIGQPRSKQHRTLRIAEVEDRFTAAVTVLVFRV